MVKNLLEMNFSELNDTLDSLLKKMELPGSVTYSGASIHYKKYNKIRLLIVAAYRLLAAELFYRKHIQKKLGGLRKARFLKTFKPYFYIFRIGLPDLLQNLGGKFDDKIAASYMMAAMLYDASCDVPQYRTYLKEFNDLIMFDRPIVKDDEFLTLFKTSLNAIQSDIDKETFETFKDYIKIEHISQLMSLYQASDKPLTKDTLLKITLAKGGITIMAGMYLMAPTITKEERKAIYELGGVLQILEDIHDMSEDLENGIQTLSNQQMVSYDEMRRLYFGSVNNMISVCRVNPTCPNTTLDLFCWLVDKVLEEKYAPLFHTEQQRKTTYEKPFTT